MARVTKPYTSAEKFQRFLGRLERQAERTRAHRLPLYERVGLAKAKNVLDVGSGSGHVTLDLAAATKGRVIGLDNDEAMLEASRLVLRGAKNVEMRQGDAHKLPFPDDTFDVVVSNLLFMWVTDPQQAAAEMARVAKPGGRVLASMEPDYGGKVHYPENPVVDQVFQGAMIERKGGDPHAGRKLRTYFVGAGLTTRIGLSNPDIPSCAEDLESYAMEKGFYRRALQDAGLGNARINQWESEYLASLREGTQLNYLPLFYAVGTKNKSGTAPRKG